MTKVVLIRHGESVWNKENLFTGWADVTLSEKGIEEAKNGGKELKKAGFTFDKAYTYKSDKNFKFSFGRDGTFMDTR